MEKVFRLRIKILKDNADNLVVIDNVNVVVYDDHSLLGYISDEQGVSHILAGVHNCYGFLIRSYNKLDDTNYCDPPAYHLWANTNNPVGDIVYYGSFIEKMMNITDEMELYEAMAELEYPSYRRNEEEINEIINILKEEINSLARTNSSLIKRIRAENNNIDNDKAYLKRGSDFNKYKDVPDKLFWS